MKKKRLRSKVLILIVNLFESVGAKMNIEQIIHNEVKA
jgi:hypothetical protein